VALSEARAWRGQRLDRGEAQGAAAAWPGPHVGRGGDMGGMWYRERRRLCRSLAYRVAQR
jgi:hypothetical protein